MAAPTAGAKDAVVIAIIDSGFSPYHLDFTSKQMPQARNNVGSDNLPLTMAPDKWLPGFPKPSAFASYNALRLSLPAAEDDRQADLYKKDEKKWAAVKRTTADAMHYYWLPGTKVIGAMSFASTEAGSGSTTSPPIYGSGGSEHGMGTASVSVGNIYGTCPECLLLFLEYADQASGERAIDWAMRQPWIDGISNSYGFGSNPVYGRDRVYGGADTDLQRAASTRGQTVFFSAGNGFENAFVVPTTTLESSQEGPDWIVTVGATSPTGYSYTGPGKPVDLAGIGSGYPSAYSSTTAGNGRPFSGTSNATPTVAGTYGRALYLARRTMAGASRVQSGGVVARGAASCGSARRTCELGDGKLTATELRMRLFQGVTPASKGYTPGGIGSVPPQKDELYASEGHGTLFARLKADERAWIKEFNQVWLPMAGRAAALPRRADERDWFVVDSWCRQHIWGEWTGGYYVPGKSQLPPPDPENHPTRTSLQESCAAAAPPPR